MKEFMFLKTICHEVSAWRSFHCAVLGEVMIHVRCTLHLWSFYAWPSLMIHLDVHFNIHQTRAGVIHHDILDFCRSHKLRYLTPAGVIHTDIFDSCSNHTY